MDREVDLERVKEIQDRFDYFKDKDKMENKIKDERFDLPGPLPDTSDEYFTTELSDPDDNLVYRNYKLLSYETKEDHRALEKKQEELKAAMKEQVFSPIRKRKD